MTHPPVNLAGATTFRMPFWRWYLATVVACQVLFTVLNVVPAVLMDPGRFHSDYYFTSVPVGLFAFPVIMAPAMLLYVLVWTVRVGPGGLRASDVWGRFATVSWHSITAAKPLPVPLIPFARVYSTETRRVLWVPLFMRRFPDYVALVVEYAGADHPVALELLKRLNPEEIP